MRSWRPSPASGRMLGDRIAHTTLRTWVAISPLGATALILGLLTGSWVLTLALGGAQHVVPHWYYVPILITAVRFGPFAAVGVAVVSGLLAGPMTPLDVATGTTQETHRWLTRMGFFVVIGGGMGSLVRSSLPSVVEEIRQRREDRALRRALGRGELFVRYQPIIDLASGGLHGVEALVRWQHPERGELGPAEFLPAAERGEVIHELGTFVLEDACRQAVRWQRMAQAAGRSAPTVAVNMSARELEAPALIERVRDQLTEAGTDPALICVEVTESTVVEDLDVSIARLAGLKSLGLTLAVDDFGTGYSSLSAVHRFPIDILKVDRSFLSAVSRQETGESLLGGLVLLARSLDLATTAEGVENERQAELVARLGYTLAQGYHFARPLTAREIDPLLRQPSSEPAFQGHPANRSSEWRQ